MEEANIITRNWWAFLLRGIAAIALGVILLAWPAATVYVFIIVFGIFALAEGIVDVILSIVLAVKKERWGMFLVKGLFGLLIGGIILSRPDIALEVVVILVGIWLIGTGLLQLIVAFDMPPESGRGLIGIGGALSILIGILILAIPFETVCAILILIAIFALLLGVLLIFIAFYALSLQRKVKPA